MLNGKIFADGMFNVKPGGIGVVSPLTDIMELVEKKVIIKVWCI